MTVLQLPPVASAQEALKFVVAGRLGGNALLKRAIVDFGKPAPQSVAYSAK